MVRLSKRLVAEGKEPGSVRVHPLRLSASSTLRRGVERLDGLPLRPASARLVLFSTPDAAGEPDCGFLESAQFLTVGALDPGWVLGWLRAPSGAFDPLALIAERPWWPLLSAAATEALTRLWRHAAAVSQAVKRLAREADDPDPDQLARIGLLHGLGRWAVAAIDPEWLARWMAEEGPQRRAEFERRTLGTETTTLGRALAERWGCDPLLADAAWLHADRDGALNDCAAQPRRLALIQAAFAQAEQTPWALAGAARAPSGPDPRIRIVTAEVQARCGSAFIEPDSTPQEEKLARSNATLRRQVVALRAGQAARDRLLNALAASDPAERPEAWAERAGLAWCGTPGVATARVVWTGTEGAGLEPADDSPRAERPATWVVPLADRGRPCAEVQLWADSEHPSASTPESSDLRAAWQAWAALVAERDRLDKRLELVVRAGRDRSDTEEPRLRQAKLGALAEFAAGAGHELNNPLAVIVGRAQLLLGKATDPDAVRSLRAILNQALRAHRILRDLMFVARPAEPRPRFCQPGELLRAAIRDLKGEADARGVRLVVETTDLPPKIWADHDGLRHLLDVLLRNALEATPKGGKVQLAATADAGTLRCTVQDTGRGITATEGPHLFDPFFCGRQAGRGLGLGLPRAARIVAQAGGELRWHSNPGQGAIFHVHLPLATPPEPPEADKATAPRPAAEGPGRNGASH